MEKLIYAKRRGELLSKMDDSSFAVITSGVSAISTGDQFYPFEVNRNFFYFTGIDRPDMKLVLLKAPGGSECVLFIPRKDPYREKWTGYIPYPEEFTEISGVVKTEYADRFDEYITSAVGGGKYERCYLYCRPVTSDTPPGEDNLLASKFANNYRFLELKNLLELSEPLRAVKSPEEKQAVIKAGKITKEAMALMLKGLKPGIYEYEAQALFEYGVYRRRARLAFNTICAGGKNATVLHYTSNDCLLNDGEMLLIDCGAALDKYNSDVTRTFPVNGRFTELQKQYYDIVLGGNMLIIEKAKAGMTIFELNEILKKYFVKELKAANLIKEDNELEKYYYHSVSHSIGLDTHDPLGKNTPMTPGNIISDEPGLYIEEYGLGIRIEDDLYITDNGCEVLTDIIKTTDEIEEVMNKL